MGPSQVSGGFLALSPPSPCYTVLSQIATCTLSPAHLQCPLSTSILPTSR